MIAIVDENRFRNDGPTKTYANNVKLAGIWRAFGWNVKVDGHDHLQLQEAFTNALEQTAVPTAIIAETTKGKGISFMEENNDWHHNRITAAVYENCTKELDITNV